MTSSSRILVALALVSAVCAVVVLAPVGQGLRYGAIGVGVAALVAALIVLRREDQGG